VRTRRWFLGGAVAAVLGAGGGVVAGLAHRSPRSAPPPAPPSVLVAALAAENALVRDLDATTGGDAAVRRIIVSARADHAAHAQALRGLLAAHPHAASTASTSTAPAPRGTARTRAQLRAAEQHAAAQAGARAAAARGEVAALLASIAACEATHVELLS
jgi:hypothetical protein